jgi:hypothetical protein
MPYFTSWDINVFLCFLSLCLPPDLIPAMVIRMKRIHEDYTEEMAREWYCSLDRYKVYIKNFHRPNEAIRELKLAWSWRCPEVRRNTIYRMIIFQDAAFMDRLKYDVNIFTGPHRIDSDRGRSKIGRNRSSEGLWDVWSSWNYYDVERLVRHVPSVTSEGKGVLKVDRRQYIANWYNNIHEGRYFLFFRENSITGYGKRKSKNISVSEKVDRFGSIHNIGPYVQVAEDLLVLDGPGLGNKGSKIEHIDDLFLD